LNKCCVAFEWYRIAVSIVPDVVINGTWAGVVSTMLNATLESIIISGMLVAGGSECLLIQNI